MSLRSRVETLERTSGTCRDIGFLSDRIRAQADRIQRLERAIISIAVNMDEKVKDDARNGCQEAQQIALDTLASRTRKASETAAITYHF